MDLPIEDIYPMTPMQLGILFHTQYAPDSAVYFIQFSLDLHGTVDVPCLIQACQQVVDRHPTLRTCFLWEDLDRPFQVVQQAVKVPCEVYDWRELPANQQQERLQQWKHADRAQPFNLAVPPLLRLALIRLADQVYHFAWSYHYLLIDGWSLGLLLNEAFTLYEAHRRGTLATLPTVHPFADYVNWLQYQDSAQAEQFWRQYLAGIDAPTPLGVALPARPDASSIYAERRVHLSAATTTALDALSRRSGITLSTLFQGLWALLLSRYSGEREVVFGVTVSGRSAPLPGIETMIGLFVNTLPLRVRVADERPLLPWLQALQAQQVEARQYEHTPLVRIQGWSEIPRGLPLFESILVLQNLPGEGLAVADGGSLQASASNLLQQTNYPLTIAVFPGEQIMIRLSYDANRFAVETIARMGGHLEQLLHSIARNANQAAGELSILTAREREQALVAWNATNGPLPRDLLHTPFAERAIREPARIAIMSSRRTLTYGDLYTYSLRVGHQVRALGARPNRLVAVVMEKGWEQTVAVLGILWAGAAYLPIDPDLPAERRHYLLENGQVEIVLTQRAIYERLSWPEAVTCVSVDDEEQLSDCTLPLPPAQALDDLAYVIFTSGSTGLPKGVMIEHGPAINTIVDINRRFAVTPDDRVLALSSLSFDLSVYDIFGALAAGAAIVVPDADRERDALHWIELIERYGVTIWNSVPALLQLLVDSLPRHGEAALRSLRLAMLSGDWIPLQLPRQLWALAPQVDVFSLGGATEASIWSILYPVTAIDPAWTSVPYGRPMLNQHVYVLDDRLEPCPIGVAGALYIGGIGLARGYWRDPEKTNAAFFQHPTTGERLYRTGDHGRYLADGVIEFLGRKDQQVKIRGFRIELEEIETVLSEHPAVQAVVVAAQGIGAERRLVAYIVARAQAGGETASWDATELRTYLATRLPTYMIPTVFIPLDALPLTSNGKVNRKALPAPQEIALPSIAEHVAPRTEVEQRLAEIWARVLGLDRVGVLDNFFELGGDSILSLQIIAQAGQSGLRLTPRLIFLHPTIAEIAAVVMHDDSTVDSVSPPDHGPLPLTPMTSWLLEQDLPEPNHFNQVVLLASATPLDPDLLQQSLDAVLAHHEALRLRLLPASADDDTRLTIAPAEESFPLTCYPIHDLAAQPATIEAIGSQIQAQLDIVHGPVIRAALFQTPNADDQLLLVAHHLAIDVVSWHILLADLQQAYDALLRGDPATLAPVPVPYRAWTTRLHALAQSAEVQAERAIWQALLADPIPMLPCDYLHGENTGATAHTYTVTLPADTTRALLRQAPSAYRMEITELLLAALERACARQWNLPALLVDLERHGRDQSSEDGAYDLSRTVGWLTALAPVCLRRSANETIAASLKRVKEQIRAVPHQGRHYGLLRYLAPAVGVPVVDAPLSFNYLGQTQRSSPGVGGWRPVSAAVGPTSSPDNPRRYLIEVVAWVADDQLQIAWTFSPTRHAPATIEQLATASLHALHDLVAHCLAPEAGTLTPSDFPLAALTQQELDHTFSTAEAAREVEDLYPLTPMQEGLLFHTLYADGGGVYVEQLLCPLHGDLDLAAFRHAWEQIVQRHPVLRTRLLYQRRQRPLQVVARRVALPLQLLDWRDRPPAQQPTALAAWLAADRAQGFDLQHAPLLRLTLIRCADAAYHFVWSYHHLLLDGWSLSLVVRDLVQLYAAQHQGTAAALPPVRPFADYVAWLQRHPPAQAEPFWRSLLAGVATPTRLAAIAPATTTPGMAQVQSSLSPEQTTALDTLGRRHGLTLSTLLQGAWAHVLSRYSGEADVVFGVTVSGRAAPVAGIETMAGLFVNTVPLRARLAADTPLLPWLHALQAQQADAREVEHTPLVQIQNWSAVPRGTPLFESTLVVENYPIQEMIADHGSMMGIPNVRLIEQSSYPLTLLALPGEHLTLSLDYDPSRVPATSAAELLRHYSRLLETLPECIEQRLGDWDLLTPDDQAVLLELSTGPIVDYPTDRCLHELIEAQVRRTPDATALKADGQVLSYQELNARANQLAHYLRTIGVGPNTLVGICTERSIEMVVGLLGILKAGAAYVPFDPSYPAERLRFMLDDTGVPVVLTQQHLVQRVDAAGIADQATLVVLDADWTSIAAQPTTNVRAEVSATNLAYVIYTSGSTGRPKGAMIAHQSIVNRLLWMQDQYVLTAADRVLQKTPFSFDVSVWEFFWPLIAGACLVVARPEGHKDSAYLIDTIRDEQITTIHFVPPMLQAFLSQPGVESCHSLKHVICSGEALSYELQERFFATLHCNLHNLYGPTEAAVDVTAWSCASDRQRAMVPIGQPIANTQIYILDHNLRLVPQAASGELYIGGVQVGRGYLNRPALTASTFVPDPFSDQPGARLYRTGDLARLLPDGAIAYQGRIDYQVKVRGFRIELGEIEAALEQHPGVQQAVVVAREDSAGGSRLFAYIVSDDSAQPQIHELREHLQSALPEYMVPAGFVFLPALPLTSNGKVDRRALPAPDTTRPLTADPFVAPQTPDELVLAEIWSRVLDLNRIGIHDNFFTLGGDSLRIIQVVTQAQAAGLAFSVEQLFHHPTIAALLGVIGTTEPTTASIIATEPFDMIDPVDQRRMPHEIEDAYPLTALQAGMLFHSAWQDDSATYHDVFSFTVRLRFEPDALQAAIQQLIARHPVLRTSFDLTTYREPLQLVWREVVSAIQIEDLREHVSDAQDQILTEWRDQERLHSFDWTIPPLLRIAVHRRTDDTAQFTIAFHHAILDGWSVATMLTELFDLYLAILHDTPTVRSPLRTRYRDFVALERGILASEQAARYWDRQLADCTIASLPAEPARTQGEQQQNTGVVTIAIPDQVQSGLQQLARLAGVPFKSVLLAAHCCTMSLLSGQVDVLTGVVADGRPETEDSHRVLGLFLNTLPLRLVLSGGTWIELARQVFAHEREAYAFRRYPIGELQHKHGGQPLFDSIFNYAHFHVYKAIEHEGELSVLGVDVFEQTNFALVAHVIFDGAQLSARLHHDTSKLSHALTQTIAGYYAAILAQMAQDPAGLYHIRSLLPADEEQWLLGAWNATHREYPHDRCLHQLFEAQAASTPDAVAVVFDPSLLLSAGPPLSSQQLTYRALNHRANQLAHYLRAHGAGPEMLVGIYLDRSLHMLVGLLGILKAGAAYVPLDPSYPVDRLAFMLKDATIPIVLTESQLANQLAPHDMHRISLDTDWAAIEQMPDTNPEALVDPANLAYTIYTSGSTGTPKGVQITQQALVNFLHDMAGRLELTVDDVWLSVTTLSFDIAALELFLPLIVGARVVVVPREVSSDGAMLLDTLHQAGATIMQATPATWRLLIAGGWTGTPALKVLCGGEALPRDLADQLIRRSSVVRNMYGPTETTIWSSTAEVTEETPLSIGQPIANTQMYLLDAHLRPVPIGVPGQLYIGGDGLARGYLHQAMLTTETFIPDPFSRPGGTPPGSRLYRTGDLARVLPGGSIEYLGRIDQQVKLRGFRIELGEIENVLSQHPQIRAVVVVARQDLVADQRLVAYVVPDKNKDQTNKEQTSDQGEDDSLFSVLCSPQDLRAFLQARIPEYMIPSAFVFLPALPLTPNGKIDRRALPAPDTIRPALAAPFVAPRTEVEQTLAEIWAQILRLDQVGIYDNFFELGGNSILSLQIVSHARQRGLHLTPRQIFLHPTIAALAPTEQMTDRGASIDAEPGPVPLTPMIHWLREQQLINPGYLNRVGLFTSDTPIDSDRLQAALNAVLDHHAALRLRLAITSDGDWQAAIASRDAPVPLTVHIGSSSAELAAAIPEVSAQVQAGLDLTHGPLFRAALFQAPTTDDRLLLVAHQMAVDLASWPILLSDLQQAYTALAHDTSVMLAPVPTSYRAWAEGLVMLAQAPMIRAEVPQWQALFAGSFPALPCDHVTGATTCATAQTITVTLSAEDTAALMQQALPTYRMEITEFLLAALDRACARQWSLPALLVDLERPGRDQDLVEDAPDLSRTIGCLTRIVPLCLRGARNEAPATTLTRIKEQTRAVPHQGRHYGLLRYLAPAVGVPVVDAPLSFNYLGQTEPGSPGVGGWRPVSAAVGPTSSPDNPRRYLIEVVAWVADDQLQIAWTFSPTRHAPATIEQLATASLHALHDLVAHCLASEAGTLTPSDFPDAGISQEELDELVAELDQEE